MPSKIVQEFNFPSLQALLDHAAEADSTLPEMSRSSRTKGNTEWYGSDSFETTMHLAQFGWDEGYKKIRALTKEIAPKFAELFPRQDCGEELVKDVAGAYEDPMLADIGIDPADMISYKPKFDDIKQGNALQRLIIETSCSCFVHPETLFCRGACVLAMLESLETFGFRIEVILQATINKSHRGDDGDGELVVARTTIKNFEEHSDYDKFAFCIANASFFRRLIFSVLETCDKKVVSDFGFHSGAAYSYPHNHPMFIDPARDFYMTRVLENKDLHKCMMETVDLINNRYKGFIQTVSNPNLGEDGGSGAPKGKG